MLLLDHFAELTLSPDNADKLKDFVQQLAVQGKLTEQWRKDNTVVEPASSLLECCAKEKQRLVKTKEIRKEPPLSPISENVTLYKLPEGWEWCRLGDATPSYKSNIVDGPFGSNLKASEYVDEGIPIIRLQNISRNKFLFKSIKFITPKKAHFLEKHNYRSGDVVICKLGDPAGKACIIPDDMPDGRIVADVVRFRTHDFVLNRWYLCFAINSPLVVNQFISEATGMTRQRVNLSKIRELVIPLPPLKEQHQIVDKVNQLLAQIEQLETQTQKRVQIKKDFAIASLHHLTNGHTQEHWPLVRDNFHEFFNEQYNIKKLKETILQLAVQGKLTAGWRRENPEEEPASVLLERIKEKKEELVKEGTIKKQKPLSPISEEEIPYELPEGWEWCKLQSVGLLERGKSKHRPRNDSALFVDGNYPLVQTGDVSNAKNIGGVINSYTNLYNDFGLSQSRMWKSGTLCITIAANIAETGFLGFDACFPDSVVGFTSLVEEITSRYVQMFIEVTKEDLEKFAPSTAQKNINLGILNMLNCPLPPLQEQHHIVSKVNHILELCKHLQNESRIAKEKMVSLTISLLKPSIIR